MVNNGLWILTTSHHCLRMASDEFSQCICLPQIPVSSINSLTSTNIFPRVDQIWHRFCLTSSRRLAEEMMNKESSERPSVLKAILCLYTPLNKRREGAMHGDVQRRHPIRSGIAANEFFNSRWIIVRPLLFGANNLIKSPFALSCHLNIVGSCKLGVLHAPSAALLFPPSNGITADNMVMHPSRRDDLIRPANPPIIIYMHNLHRPCQMAHYKKYPEGDSPNPRV